MTLPGLLLPPLSRLLSRLGDLVLPPRCPACGGTVSAQGRFCLDCWSGLRFVGPPWCAACHVPFEHDAGGERRCDACRDRPPRHSGVRAALAYGPAPRALALQLKYGRRTGHAATAAKLMRRHVPEDADVLVPVPLHRWRLSSRGYNQAGLIAAALGVATGIPAHQGVIQRYRSTQSLRGLSGRARRAAVHNAFRLVPGASGRIAGRHVVLVDDVYTSGATTDACVDVLLAEGAGRVSILAFARVIDPSTAD